MAGLHPFDPVIESVRRSGPMYNFDVSGHEVPPRVTPESVIGQLSINPMGVPLSRDVYRAIVWHTEFNPCVAIMKTHRLEQ